MPKKRNLKSVGRRTLGKGKKHGYGRKIVTKETVYIRDGQKGICRERVQKCDDEGTLIGN
jgi:hypothetical protein